MFDPNLDFPEPSAPRARPEPRRLQDPQQSPWLPADLEEEMHRKPKLTTKQRVAHLLHVIMPIAATLVGLAVLGYVLLTLIGVYS